MSKNLIALVTGASGYVGEAICMYLIEFGYTVFALDKVPIKHKYYNNFFLVDLDEFVTNEEKRLEVLTDINLSAKSSKLSVLINNAAYQFISKNHPINLAELNSSYNINVLAPYYLTTLLSKSLIDSVGKVVNVSSIHCRLTKPGFLAYSASKAALSAITRSLAIDYGGKFSIVCIEPGAIDTPMLRQSFGGSSEKLSELLKCHPSSTIATPDDIAKMIALICNSDLKFLNGSCIEMSGGMSGRLHDPD